MVTKRGIPTGNFYNKYGSSNFIVKKIMDGFFQSLESSIRLVSPVKCLDVGCGEGHLTSHVKKRFSPVEIKGIDIGDDVIETAKRQYPDIDFQVGNIYALPFPDNSFDLVLGCEVLEHVNDPVSGLRELIRVSSSYCLVSVPREPIWRICNMLRGKYLNSFGNTPGHIKHWSRKDFIDFVSCYAKIKLVTSPFPWTMILCEKTNYE